MEQIMKQQENSKRKSKSAAILKKGIPYIGVVIVMIFFQIVSNGTLLTIRNAPVLMNEAFSIMLAAVGILFLMSQGNLDLSLGAMIALSASIGALATKINPYLLLPMALAAGALMGAINGFFFAKMKVTAFVVTLAMSFVYKGIAEVILDGSMGVPYFLRVFDNNALKAAVLLIVLVGGYILFEFTKYGKQCRAVGALPEAARQSGVNVVRVRWIAFIISGLMCGLIAFFSVVRTTTAGIMTGGGMEIKAQLALMVGGLSITGGWSSKFRTVIIGSVIIAVISNGMTIWGIDGVMQQLVRGVIFILAVTLSFDRKGAAVIK